jgi:hypothetical protein
MTRLARVRFRMAATALVVLAVWEVAVLVSARRSAPTRADWQAVAAGIPATLGPDELVVFAPPWIDPVGRQWLGDRLSIAKVARMDAVRYSRIWEVSARGASAPEAAGAPAASEQQFGALRLRRIERDAPVVTWSISDELRLCEIAFEPRQGQLLELRRPFAQALRDFPQVTLGSELQVYAGLADYKKRTTNQSRALVQVLVDGREVARATAGNDDGWVALPLAATASGPHDVRIVARVLNPSGPVDLEVCVAAEARMRQR